MQDYVLYTHLVVGILFIFSVLIQDKGVGFGSAIGGAGGGSFHSTKRGAAKFFHNAALLFAFLFLVTAVLYVVVPPSQSLDSAPAYTDLPITGSEILDSVGVEAVAE